MGLIRSCFQFMAGTIFGVYVAQNYNVPNVQKLYSSGSFIAKNIEEIYRKPKKEEE